MDEQVSSDSARFRPIHYLGSKLRMLAPIRQTVDRIDPACGPLCDLFSGSGTVAVGFADSRRVIAVDIQEYARVLASAILRPASIDENTTSEVLRNAHASSRRIADAFEPLVNWELASIEAAQAGDPEPISDLLECGSLVAYEGTHQSNRPPQLREAYEAVQTRLEKLGLRESADSVVTRYYGGLYFSFRQAAELDGLLAATFAKSGDVRDSLLAAVLSAASDIVNTVGKQFAQPIKPRDSIGSPKRHLIQKITRDRSLSAIDAFTDWLKRYASIHRLPRNHETYREDFRGFLDRYDGRPSVIYADPPYTRDHYSRYYHVLETMCLRDNPVVSQSVQGGRRMLSRGLYREARHQSPFCIATKAPSAFEDLFAKGRRFSVPLVLSYSPFDGDRGERPRVVKLDQLRRMAASHFRSVEIVPIADISHNKLGWSEVEGTTESAEQLLIALP